MGVMEYAVCGKLSARPSLPLFVPADVRSQRVLQLGSKRQGWAGLLPPPDDSVSEDQEQLPARDGICDISWTPKPTVDNVASLDLPQHLGPDGRVHLLVLVVVLGLQLHDLPASRDRVSQLVSQSPAGLSGACLGDHMSSGGNSSPRKHREKTIRPWTTGPQM